jgi:hypothetical protein
LVEGGFLVDEGVLSGIGVVAYTYHAFWETGGVLHFWFPEFAVRVCVYFELGGTSDAVTSDNEPSNGRSSDQYVDSPKIAMNKLTSSSCAHLLPELIVVDKVVVKEVNRGGRLKLA